MSNVQSIPVKREGYAWSSDTSGHQFMIFDRQVVEAVIGPVADWPTDRLAGLLTAWSAFHRGVGRGFGEKPTVKLYRHAVLVTQFTALDI